MRDLMNGLPWWVKAIGLVGFPIFVALFFMGQAAGILPSADQENKKVLVEIRNYVATQDARTVQLLDRLTMSLRIMCENGSRTPAERNNCLNIR